MGAVSEESLLPYHCVGPSYQTQASRVDSRGSLSRIKSFQQPIFSNVYREKRSCLLILKNSYKELMLKVIHVYNPSYQKTTTGELQVLGQPGQFNKFLCEIQVFKGAKKVALWQNACLVCGRLKFNPQAEGERKRMKEGSREGGKKEEKKGGRERAKLVECYWQLS